MSLRSFHRGRSALCAAALAAASLGACVLEPEGAQAERERLAAAGAPWQGPREQRVAPEWPASPDWRDLLHAAFLSNGDLEAAWHEWAAAVARIEAAGAWPNTNVSVGLDYLFSDSRMKAWDRTTLSVGFDPMENLSWPSKTTAAAQVALDEARAAAERFAAVKFDLQRRVLQAWAEYALLGERLRLAREADALAALVASSAAGRVAAGGGQQSLLDAQVAVAMAGDARARLEARVPRALAELNALLGREPQAPLPMPVALPAPRELLLDDSALLALGVAGNRELAALAQSVAGREDALELARRQYLPDINPFAMVTGSVEWAAGAAVSLPTTLPELDSVVTQARAALAGERAMLHQARLDRAAAFVNALSALRDAERQVALFGDALLPLAERLAGNSGALYASAGADLQDVLKSEQTLLDVRGALAEARIARENSLAELEALAGIDIETLSGGDGR